MKNIAIHALACLISLVFAVAASAATNLTSKEDVKAAFAKHRPMVIMFHTEWCGFCMATKPAFLEAEKKFAGKVDFYLMDTDKLQLRMDHKNGGIPAFVAGNSEKEVRSAKSLQEGAMNQQHIEEYVTKYTGVKP